MSRKDLTDGAGNGKERDEYAFVGGGEQHDDFQSEVEEVAQDDGASAATPPASPAKQNPKSPRTPQGKQSDSNKSTPRGSFQKHSPKSHSSLKLSPAGKLHVAPTHSSSKIRIAKKPIEPVEKELSYLEKIPNVAFRQLVSQVIKQNREDAKKAAEGGDAELREIMNFWNGQDSVANKENVERDLQKISDIFARIAREKGGNVDFAKISQRMSGQSRFFQYVVEFTGAHQEQVKTLMKAICSYCSFISIDDEKMVQRANIAAISFPPENQYLLCLPATINRINELFETQSCSPENLSVIEEHHMVLRQYVNKLRNSVYDGNEIHIPVFLEYALGMISSAEAAKIDENYRSPADEISASFLADFLINYSKKVKARIANSIKGRYQEFCDAIENAVNDVLNNKDGDASEEITNQKKQEIFGKLKNRKEGEERESGIDAVGLENEEELEIASKIYEELSPVLNRFGASQSDAFTYLDDETSELANFEKYIFLLPQNFHELLRENPVCTENARVVRRQSYANFNFLSLEFLHHLKELFQSKNSQDHDLLVDLCWCFSRNYVLGHGLKMLADFVFNNNDNTLAFERVYSLRDRFGATQEGGDLFNRRDEFFRSVLPFRELNHQNLRELVQQAVNRMTNGSEISKKEMAKEFMIACSFYDSIFTLKSELDSITRPCEADFFSFFLKENQPLARFANSDELRLPEKGLSFDYHDLCRQVVMRPDAVEFLRMLSRKNFEIEENGELVVLPLVCVDFFNYCAFFAARYGRAEIIEFLLREGALTDDALSIGRIIEDDPRNSGRTIIHYLTDLKRCDLLIEIIGSIGFFDWQNDINRNLLASLLRRGNSHEDYPRALVYMAGKSEMLLFFQTMADEIAAKNGDHLSLFLSFVFEDLAKNSRFDKDFSFLLNQIAELFKDGLDFKFVAGTLSESNFFPSRYLKIFCDWAVQNQLPNAKTFQDLVFDPEYRENLLNFFVRNNERAYNRLDDFVEAVSSLTIEEKSQILAMMVPEILRMRKEMVLPDRDFDKLKNVVRKISDNLVRDRLFVLPHSLQYFLSVAKDRERGFRDSFNALQAAYLEAILNQPKLREDRLSPKKFIEGIDLFLQSLSAQEQRLLQEPLDNSKKNFALFSRDKDSFLNAFKSCKDVQKPKWLIENLASYFKNIENFVVAGNKADPQYFNSLKEEVTKDLCETFGALIESSIKAKKGGDHNFVLKYILGFEIAYKVKNVGSDEQNELNDDQKFALNLIGVLRDFRVGIEESIESKGVEVKYAEKVSQEVSRYFKRD